MEFVARAGSPPWGATAPRGVWRAVPRHGVKRRTWRTRTTRRRIGASGVRRATRPQGTSACIMAVAPTSRPRACGAGGASDGEARRHTARTPAQTVTALVTVPRLSTFARRAA